MDGSDPRRVAQTNDSSIVSKRSAERAGYFDEDQFLRQFCAKVVRRAPLINLGYAIRTTLLDEVITSFILDAIASASRGDELFVVNLGAGFDPSFFRVETKWRRLLHERGLCLRWVDVDFPPVIANKLSIVESQLRRVFTSLPTTETWLQNGDGSLAYALVGCDMCDAASLMSRLQPLVPCRTEKILFLSEVALVYMPSASSDALLDAILETYGYSTYAFLEQLVPFDEPEAAFASTMMHHFERNVRTPLWGTLAYPTLQAQESRFAPPKRWGASLMTMLEAWRGLASNKPEVARRLFSVEPFDEWSASSGFASCLALTSSAGRLSIFSCPTTFSDSPGQGLMPSVAPSIPPSSRACSPTGGRLPNRSQCEGIRWSWSPPWTGEATRRRRSPMAGSSSSAVTVPNPPTNYSASERRCRPGSPTP